MCREGQARARLPEEELAGGRWGPGSCPGLSSILPPCPGPTWPLQTTSPPLVPALSPLSPLPAPAWRVGAGVTSTLLCHTTPSWLLPPCSGPRPGGQAPAGQPLRQSPLCLAGLEPFVGLVKTASVHPGQPQALGQARLGPRRSWERRVHGGSDPGGGSLAGSTTSVPAWHYQPQT